MKTPRIPCLAAALLTLTLAFPSSLPAQAAQAAPAPSPAAGGEEPVVKLSPFTVDASKDNGYYAESTLAGSRINTNLGDLASSITVVTKQQLTDTSSMNVNDVFMYEANTEGANTYTPVLLNRGAAKDTQGGYSQDDGTPFGAATSNRVRGLDIADSAQNNYPTIRRIPFDSYNTQSVEINRGPNSLLFGTGSPAGIVNQSLTEPNLTRSSTSVEARYGSWDSFRETVGHNHVILKDRLAVYGAQLYDSPGFARKPSSDVTKRYYGAVTFKPFQRTKLFAAIEGYRNANRRPNFQTPRDYVTPWLQSGRPAYNPVTRMLTFLDRPGLVFGPFVLAANSQGYTPTYTGNTFSGQAVTNAAVPANNNALTVNTSPWFTPGIAFNDTRATMMIDDGQLQGFWQTTPGAIAQPAFATGAPATRTPAQQAIFDIRQTISAALPNPTGYGTWYTPGASSKTIYNWERDSVVSSNFGDISAKTFNVELQQQVIRDLYLSVGWFRQEVTSHDNYYLAQQQATTLYVDTNTVLPDGTPNPYFGSPYVKDTQGDTFSRPEINNNLRAMLAYEYDFTRNQNFTRWLGRHRLLLLGSRQDNIINNLRYRFSFNGGDSRFLPAPPAVANNYSFPGNSGSINRNYYLGQNTTGQATHGGGTFGNPGWGGPSTGAVRTYNWTTGAFESANVEMGTELFYAGQNYGVAQKRIDARNIAWQGYLLDNRIIPTFGWREDRFKARAATFGGLTTPDQYVSGKAIPGLHNRLTPWQYLSGRTKTYGAVVRPFRRGPENSSSGPRALAAEFIRNFSLSYNKSDNFNPPSGVQNDFFGNPLPKPEGEGKDYGIGFTLFDNRLVARLNWFESNNLNAPAVSASTALTRTQRMDTGNFRSWAEYVVRVRAGGDPTSANFTTANLTPAQQTQVADLMGLPYTWPAGLNIAATQQNISEGLEAQVIYNPTPSWNFKFTLGRQKSTYDRVAPELDVWLADRMAKWQSATASDMPALVTMANGTQLALRNFYTGYGFNADARITNTDGNTTPGSFWENTVQPEINVAKALQGNTVPNEREWSGSLISNYAFREGALKGFGLGGAVRWADRAVAGFFGDRNNLNSTGLIVASDVNRPIYTPEETHIDLWLSYQFRLPWWSERVATKLQLNVRDVTEGGRLLPIVYNFDGSPAYYRIVDPRQWYVTAKFEF